MSQAGLARVSTGVLPPSVPLQFTTNSGIAVPVANNLNTLGSVVAAGTNPFRSIGAGSTVTYQIQTSQAIAATDATKIGLSNFNSAQFTVDGNGFVSLIGSGAIETLTGNSGGAISPVAGNINTVGTGSITIAGAGSTLTTQLTGLTNHSVQVGAATATLTQLAVGTNGQVLIGANAADPAFATLTSSDSSITFTTGANTLSLQVAGGTTTGKTITGQSGGALSPTGGNWNIFGASTAAGTSPVVTSGAASTLTVNVQKSQAIAATDATKVGLANFNSTQFTVDANGFVSTSGTGVANTITGDSGGALSPTAGNWNIVGLSGSKTSGSGSTLTIKSPPFSQVAASATSVLNSGEFVTAAVTRTLPATGGLADGDLVIYYCTTAGALVVTGNTGQTIRIGSAVSSAAGTATSTAIGDSLTLRFDATGVSWRAVSVVGNWTLA
jgi:fibronectin-binding autotransporter adhesin